MPYNNRCRHCVARGYACTTHADSSPARPYRSTSYDPPSETALFIDSSADLAAGSPTGVGIDLSNGDLTVGGVDMGPNNTDTSCATSSSPDPSPAYDPGPSSSCDSSYSDTSSW